MFYMDNIEQGRLKMGTDCVCGAGCMLERFYVGLSCCSSETAL